jgi:uncharacterized membrane protein YhaH (DUF805 family)
MCGTATVSKEEWVRNGNCCGICGNSTHRDECTRCRVRCEGDESPRRCLAVTAYRETGRVAFPEKIAEAAKREAAAKRQREKQKAAEKNARERQQKLPTPAPPPSSGDFGNVVASAWRRYWSSLGKYAVCNGRSNRAEVFAFVAGQFAGLLATSLFGAAPLFLLATAIPTWALAVRRLHDANLSGKWLWLLVVWPIAVLVLPVMLLMPGTATGNRYGMPSE